MLAPPKINDEKYLTVAGMRGTKTQAALRSVGINSTNLQQVPHYPKANSASETSYGPWPPKRQNNKFRYAPYELNRPPRPSTQSMRSSPFQESSHFSVIKGATDIGGDASVTNEMIQMAQSEMKRKRDNALIKSLTNTSYGQAEQTKPRRLHTSLQSSASIDRSSSVPRVLHISLPSSQGISITPYLENKSNATKTPRVIPHTPLATSRALNTWMQESKVTTEITPAIQEKWTRVSNGLLKNKENKGFDYSGSQGAASSPKIQLPNLERRWDNSPELQESSYPDSALVPPQSPSSANSRTTSPTNSSNSTTPSQFEGQSYAGKSDAGQLNTGIAHYEYTSDNYSTFTHEQAQEISAKTNPLQIGGGLSSAFTGSTPPILSVNDTSGGYQNNVFVPQSPSSAEHQEASSYLKKVTLFSESPLVSWEEGLANSIKNNSNYDHPAQSTNTHSSQNPLSEVPRGRSRYNYPQDPEQQSPNLKERNSAPLTRDTNFIIVPSGEIKPPIDLHSTIYAAAPPNTTEVTYSNAYGSSKQNLPLPQPDSQTEIEVKKLLKNVVHNVVNNVALGPKTDQAQTQQHFQGEGKDSIQNSSSQRPTAWNGIYTTHPLSAHQKVEVSTRAKQQVVQNFGQAPNALRSVAGSSIDSNDAKAKAPASNQPTPQAKSYTGIFATHPQLLVPLEAANSVTRTPFYPTAGAQFLNPAELAPSYTNILSGGNSIKPPEGKMSNTQTSSLSSPSSRGENSKDVVPEAGSNSPNNLTPQIYENMIEKTKKNIEELKKGTIQDANPKISLDGEIRKLARFTAALEKQNKAKEPQEGPSQQNLESVAPPQPLTQDPLDLGNTSPITASPLDATHAKSTKLVNTQEENRVAFREIKESLKKALNEGQLGSDGAPLAESTVFKLTSEEIGLAIDKFDKENKAPPQQSRTTRVGGDTSLTNLEPVSSIQSLDETQNSSRHAPKTLKTEASSQPLNTGDKSGSHSQTGPLPSQNAVASQHQTSSHDVPAIMSQADSVVEQRAPTLPQPDPQVAKKETQQKTQASQSLQIAGANLLSATSATSNTPALTNRAEEGTETQTQTPQLIEQHKGEAPNATPTSPQNPGKNSYGSTFLSSAYNSFVATCTAFRNAFTSKKSAENETGEGEAKPSTSMTARFWEALASMVPSRFKSNSNSGTTETDPLLPKNKENKSNVGRS